MLKRIKEWFAKRKLYTKKIIKTKTVTTEFFFRFGVMPEELVKFLKKHQLQIQEIAIDFRHLYTHEDCFCFTIYVSNKWILHVPMLKSSLHGRYAMIPKILEDLDPAYFRGSVPNLNVINRQIIPLTFNQIISVLPAPVIRELLPIDAEYEQMLTEADRLDPQEFAVKK